MVWFQKCKGSDLQDGCPDLRPLQTGMNPRALMAYAVAWLRSALRPLQNGLGSKVQRAMCSAFVVPGHKASSECCGLKRDIGLFSQMGASGLVPGNAVEG